MRRSMAGACAAICILSLPLASRAGEEDDRLVDEALKLAEEGEYEKAIEVYRQAVKAFRGNCNALMGIGDCLMRLHRYDDALAEYQKVLDVDTLRGRASAAAHRDMGHAYFKKADYGKGIESLKASAKLYGEDYLTWRYLGQCHQELNQWEACAAAYEKSLKLKPDQEDMRKNLEAIKLNGTDRKPTFEAVFTLPSFGGAVTTPDMKTLVVAVPSRAELAYFEASTKDEPKRVSLEFQPSRIALQGKSLFGIAHGAARLHVLELETGKVQKSFKVPGAALVEIACHRTKGLVYGVNTAGEVLSVDPSTGKVTATQARGTLVAVDPAKAFVYTAGPGEGAKSDPSRTVLRKYAVQGADLKLVDTNPDVAVRGFSLQVTPDGKRVAVAGEGFKAQGQDAPDANAIAVFETESIKTPAGTIEAGGRPLALAFHPLLDLAALATEKGLAQIDSKSLVKSQSWPVARGSAQGALAFASGGAKLVYWQPGDAAKKEDGTLAFVSLKLTPDDTAALEKALKGR